MIADTTRIVVCLLANLLLASVALAQPGDLQDFPAHPGGRVDLRRVVSGPLAAAEIESVLATVPGRLRRCAVARARHPGHTASGFDFQLEVRPDGRARALDLVADPRDERSPHERAWVSCARRVMGLLRFPVKDALSVLRLNLVWMRDDVPHGDGLI